MTQHMARPRRCTGFTVTDRIAVSTSPSEYRKIKRSFPPTASAHPHATLLPLVPAPGAAHPGEHPTRACPRRPAPPGATPRRRARIGRVAGDGLPARLEGLNDTVI